MNTWQTRFESFVQIQPQKMTRQMQVYHLLQEASRNGFSMTDREIAKALHWSINCVTPRRNELVGQGLIVEAEVKFDYETRRNVVAWKARLEWKPKT